MRHAFGKLAPTPAPPGLPPSSFWSSVNFTGSPTGCWIWCGSLTKFGHGVAVYRGRSIGAHRVSYDLVRGAVELGLVLRHRCDNAPCVNPDHLVPGTQADNNDDMVTRGRAPWQRMKLDDPGARVCYAIMSMWARAHGIDPQTMHRWIHDDAVPATVVALLRADGVLP